MIRAKGTNLAAATALALLVGVGSARANYGVQVRVRALSPGFPNHVFIDIRRANGVKAINAGTGLRTCGAAFTSTPICSSTAPVSTGRAAAGADLVNGAIFLFGQSTECDQEADPNCFPIGLASAQGVLQDELTFDLPPGMNSATVTAIMWVSGSVRVGVSFFGVAQLQFGSLRGELTNLRNLPGRITIDLVVSRLLPGGLVHFISGNMVAVVSGNSFFDFSNTAAIELVLPAGVTFTSSSGGRYLGPSETPPPDLDHFKCYEAEGDGSQLGRPVDLVDQFEDQLAVLVGETELFCNPVAKTVGQEVTEIGDTTAHLTGYEIEGDDDAERIVTISNQFGEQTLEVEEAELLFVPSEKDGQVSALNIDHFKCYEADGDPVNVNVDLQDQFGVELDVLVGEPELFCNPVDKNGEGIKDESSHLTCYDIKDDEDEAAGENNPVDDGDGDELGDMTAKRVVSVSNQLAEQALEVEEPKLLCVPSEKLEVILRDDDDAPLDSDGDTVFDVDDVCADTVIPEAVVPTQGLGNNRHALVTDDTIFDTKKKGTIQDSEFTVQDTAGCSCEQIIEEQGLGQGHIKFGCSNGAMKNWIEQVGGGSPLSPSFVPRSRSGSASRRR